MSTNTTPFGFQRDGRTLVVGDGPELLVYEGSGAPRWKLFLDDIIIGVGANQTHVIALLANGDVQFFRSHDGELHDTVSVPGGTSLAYTEAMCAVPTGDAVRLVGPGGTTPLPMAGACAVAIGPGGESLGIGTASGQFYAVDPASGGAWGSQELGTRVTGVAWSQMGYWVVACGVRMHLISGDGQELLHTFEDQEGPLTHLTTTPEGAVIAALVHGTSDIAVFELQHKKRIGQIKFRRPIGGIRFGPKALLGVGLDDADASTVDLFNGRSERTEPHPGRGRNNWNLKSEVDFGAVRGAVSFAKAGGSAIASFVYIEEDEGRGWMSTCLGCGGLFLFTLVCCGGATTIYYVVTGT